MTTGKDSIGDQTNALFGHIAGRRDSERLRDETQAVLRNLQGHRDRGEALDGTTETLLQAISQGPSPQQLQTESLQRARAFATKNPEQYTNAIMTAVTTELISPEHGIEFLSLADDPLLLAARQYLREELERHRRARQLEQRQWEQTWAWRQQQAGTITTEEPEQPTEPEEPEEAEEHETPLGIPVGKQPLPRRILRKLRLPKEGKEVTDDHDHQPR